MQKLNFDIHRLGQARSKMDDVEPIIRNADLVSFDIGAIRHSEAPGNANASPNGFFGDEACQLSRYAGISDKCTSIGIYELNPEFDPNNLTSHLVAQMVWCFADGFYNRKKIFHLLIFQITHVIGFFLRIINTKLFFINHQGVIVGGWRFHILRTKS